MQTDYQACHQDECGDCSSCTRPEEPVDRLEARLMVQQFKQQLELLWNLNPRTRWRRLLKMASGNAGQAALWECQMAVVVGKPREKKVQPCQS